MLRGLTHRGGADDIVLKYDASQLGRPLTPQPARYPNSTFRQHDVSRTSSPATDV